MIPFSKAHACGNDFLIVTEDSAAKRDWAELTRQLCARNTGVGADGIEFFAWTGSKSGRVRLHNADGSIAEISGNGTRCVAAWMSSMIGAKAGDELRIETDAGLRICRINNVLADGGYSVEVTTGMGIPSAARKIVTLGRRPCGGRHRGLHWESALCDLSSRTLTSLLPEMSWQTIGAEICTHSDFLHQTNVEFVRIVGPGEIEIRIFERGVGPTTSSGTGTSASATAAIAFHGCTSPLRVVCAGRSADRELARAGQRAGTYRACNPDCARRGVVRMTTGSKPLMSLGPIGPGAGVSVISPASFAIPERVEPGVERLRRLGYVPRLGTNTQTRGPLFFAGTSEERLADFHAAFADPETSFVAAVRGGYGSNYLLEAVDLALIANHPKPFFAYSDHDRLAALAPGSAWASCISRPDGCCGLLS